MRPRDFITVLGALMAAPVVQPFVARADKARRIGVLVSSDRDDPESQTRLAAFADALQKFGWTEGSTWTLGRWGPIFRQQGPN
jgi:putative ABC transport system substrate-binding protein